jgi:hypothetical protein
MHPPPVRELLARHRPPESPAVAGGQVEEEVDVGEAGIAVARQPGQAPLLPVPGEIGQERAGPTDPAFEEEEPQLRKALRHAA